MSTKYEKMPVEGGRRMRLIDADKLKVMCETVHDITPKLIIFDRMMVSYENIDLSPTVEAIPIKWLKKRIP